MESQVALTQKEISKTAQEWFEEAVKFYNINNLKKSIECYEKAIELEPNNALYLCSKIETLNILGLWQESLANLNKADTLKQAGQVQIGVNNLSSENVDYINKILAEEKPKLEAKIELLKRDKEIVELYSKNAEESEGKMPDVKILYELVSKANERIGEQKAEQAILVMGETGAGKSTLACLFAEKTLKAISNDEGELYLNVIVEETNNIAIGDNSAISSTPEIGNSKISTTHIPNKVISKSGIVIWDCPGFGDLGRGAMQDIVNAFYVQRLFETTKKLKFVLTVPEYHTKGRGADLIRIINDFVKIFKNVEQIKDSVSLVITHASANKQETHIKKILENISSDNQELSEPTKKMFQYLAKSISMFYAPQREGLYEPDYSHINNSGDNDIIATIEHTTEYMTTNSSTANVVISDKSRMLAEALFSKSCADLLKGLVDISHNIITVCDKVNVKGKMIETSVPARKSSFSEFFLGTLKQYISFWNVGNSTLLSTYQTDNQLEKESYSDESDILYYKELLNLHGILAFKQFCQAVIEDKPISQWLEVIDNSIGSAVMELTLHNKAQIELLYNLGVLVKENIKYVKFLAKIGHEKSLLKKNFIDVFNRCKVSVDEAAKQGVESLELSDTEKDVGYYHKALELLKLYPDSDTNGKCIAIEAKSYFHIARLKQKTGDYQEATKYYVEALKLDGTLEPAYDGINASYFASNGIAIISENPTTLQIIKKLLKDNTEEVSVIIKEITEFYQDYQTNGKYFAEFSLKHLKNLSNLIDLTTKIIAVPVVQNLEDFFDNLSIVSLILAKHIKALENNIGNLEVLNHKINYVGILQAKAKDAQLSNLANNWSEAFKLEVIKENLFKVIKTINVDLTRKDQEYTNEIKEIIGYVEKYPDDAVCIKLHAYCHLILARIKYYQEGCNKNYSEEKNDNDNHIVHHYKEAIKFNDKLHEICRDNSYYATNSIKRVAVKELGDLYYNIQDYKSAISCYGLIDQYIKVNECFCKLIELEPENASFREERAEYLSKIPIPAREFFEVLGFTDNAVDHARIYKKMAQILREAGIYNNKADEYEKKAEHIENTQVIYKVNDIRYNKPILNYPEAIKKIANQFGVNTNQVINKLGDCDTEFVEVVCLSEDFSLFQGIF